MSIDPAALPYRACVGIVLINKSGLVWQGHRIAHTEAGVTSSYWQCPQGGIDPGETPEAAALRELHEETGTTRAEILGAVSGWLSYDLPEDQIGIAFKGKYRGQRQKWFALRYLGDDTDFSIIPPPPHKQEFDKWRWGPLNEMPGLVVPFKRPVYETLVAEFSPLLVQFENQAS
jgi:putative (di)nucleoside polyphosphate hydrolase